MIQTHCISKRFNLAQNPPFGLQPVYDKGMKNEIASFLLVPANPKLAGLGNLWEEFTSLDAAEDRQIELADCGLDYDVLPVLA